MKRDDQMTMGFGKMDELKTGPLIGLLRRLIIHYLLTVFYNFKYTFDGTFFLCLSLIAYLFFISYFKNSFNCVETRRSYASYTLLS